MDSDENQVISGLKSIKRVYKHSSSSQNEGILYVLGLIQREKHRKKLQSARNKRYYQRHKDKILTKQRLKNQLYDNYIHRS